MDNTSPDAPPSTDTPPTADTQPADATPPTEDQPAPDSTAVTQDPIDVNRQASDDANQNGPDAEIVECPTCHNPRRRFLIVNGKCDSCRTQGQPAAIVPTLGWPEVRARRDRVIQGTDWTQLADVPQSTRDAYSPLRTRLRDVTTKADPFEGWYELDHIEAAIAAL